MGIKLKLSGTENFVRNEEYAKIQPAVKMASDLLYSGKGAGNDYIGWVDLPNNYDKDEFERIKKAAKKIQSNSEVLIVIGIGGSYLGGRAALEFVNGVNFNKKVHKGIPEVYFVGNSISSDYLSDIIEILGDRDFSINVISKSGTTTEPAIAFRIFKKIIEDKYGKEGAKERIFATTDKARGALKSMCNTEGYETFVIPDDVGGRFSVLTPVGLLPIAVAGFDVKQLVAGAVEMEKACGKDVAFEENPAAIYAATRQALYTQAGKKIEIVCNFQPKLHYFAEWWKQLYGESEGKDQKGIFPAACDFTTDLHSMGQWIQEGERSIFETVISVETPNEKLLFPHDDENLDGLNFLEGKRVDEVNKMAELGTRLAHVDGGVPNILVNVPELNAYYLGQLIYFFEKACGISGLLEEVNPFNQPGVEAYKKNMFALLNKPGYEAESKAIQERLKNE